MIIVNQDRDEIVNFENINNIFIFYDNEVRACGNVDGNIYTLGRYETKERAKEVLQEIVERYRHQTNKHHFTEVDNVYEMPEK